MEGKGNIVPMLNSTSHHADVWGVEVQLHVFVTPTFDEESGQPHAPAALPPGKNTRYPLDRRLGGL